MHRASLSHQQAVLTNCCPKSSITDCLRDILSCCRASALQISCMAELVRPCPEACKRHAQSIVLRLESLPFDDTAVKQLCGQSGFIFHISSPAGYDIPPQVCDLLLVTAAGKCMLLCTGRHLQRVGCSAQFRESESAVVNWPGYRGGIRSPSAWERFPGLP